MKLRTLLVAAMVVAACGPKPAPRTQPEPPPPATTTTQGQPAAEPPLPLWPQVKRGVLPNGLTYYVLPHRKPEQRAFLWLAVNAGSVQEDDDQQGLAHFVEHMAFNGTRRFPKQAIVNYLESIGMKFGPDLNAYTSFDETVYQLQVPTDDPALVAKGLDILHDWAADIAFDAVEVDKERGVVLEEWRLGRGAQQRLLDKLIKVIFAEARYASRIPIGKPEILKQAPRDALVRFYKDWYRPDLMAVFAVGDFKDTAAIEQQIRAKFGDLANPAKPRPRTAGGVPTGKATRVAVETDKELPLTLVGVGNLIAHRPEASATDFRRIVAEQLYVLMLNERLQTIARRPDAPFTMAGAIIQSITREADAFARFAVVKHDDVEAALQSMFTEVLRIERHGFVQSELDRARTVMARNYEQSATEAATQHSRELVSELVRNFLEGEFVVGREAERDLALATLPKITLGELNTLARAFGGAENRVIVVAGPEGKPMPTQARVLALVGEVGKAKIEAWVDEPAPAELMKRPAWPGTVEKETKIAELGVTEWRLSNGVRVIVKPTDFEKDSVIVAGGSPGGLAMTRPRELVHARFAAEIAAAGGVGELDADALGKALAGKQVDVRVRIGDVSELVEGSGSVRDLETLLQLVHLRMTAPRRDERAFTVWKANSIEALENEHRSPEAVYFKRSDDELWKNHPYRRHVTAADVKQADLDKALAFYRARFADASDFTFVVVGAVDLAKLRPLVEAYLGSLPGSGKHEKERDTGARRVGGVVKKAWKLGQDPAKAYVRLVFHGNEAWSRDKERDMFILGRVLSIRLREILREDLGGVYGVGASGGIQRSPRQERQFTIQFGCAPGAVDKLIGAALTEIAAIAKQGIDAKYLSKIEQAYVRERETSMRTNRFWVQWLGQAARYGDDPKLILDPKPMIARMTSANVKAAAARFLDRRRLYRAVMLPAAAKPAP